MGIIVKYVAGSVVLLAVLGVSACGGEDPVPAETWVGTWTVSVEDSVAVAERMARCAGLGVDEGLVRLRGEAAGRIARAVMSTVHIHDGGRWRDGEIAPASGKHQEAGTWRVELGHLFLYVTERDGEAVPREGTVTYVFARNGSMIWPIHRLVANGVIPDGGEGSSLRIVHRREE